ncbi:MAG: hypothetical protein IIU45_04820 [Lachnospiraceae bacterium]|nr:hypothetical protein [Lachnospiraceae bacterium]
MSRMNEKQKNPYRGLFAIPVAILCNVLLFWLATWMDTKLVRNPKAHGHPIPVFTGFCIMGLPVIDLIILLTVVIVTIVRVKKANRNKE